MGATVPRHNGTMASPSLILGEVYYSKLWGIRCTLEAEYTPIISWQIVAGHSGQNTRSFGIVNISIRIAHALFNAHFPGEPGLAGCPCEVLGLARFVGRMSFLTSASRNTLDVLHLFWISYDSSWERVATSAPDFNPHPESMHAPMLCPRPRYAICRVLFCLKENIGKRRANS